MEAHAGLCAFVRGRYLKLLVLVEDYGDFAIWKAETLFVSPPTELEVLIRPGEQLRSLYDQAESVAPAQKTKRKTAKQ